MAYHGLDSLDEKILNLITDNARIPYLEVARECGVSGAAIHQRVQKLTTLGVIKGSEFILDEEKIGFETCAYIGIFLTTPGSYDEAVKQLQKIPEVVECYYTTGKYDLLIKVFARNNHDLLNLIHDKLQPIGLARTETLVSFREAFRKKLPINFSENNDEE
jgi:Lrp/AsnC family transcriptional regulator for asnA, asnC and gidA